MPHNAKTIPDHEEKQNSPGNTMQHNAYPLSIRNARVLSSESTRVAVEYTI